MLKLLLVDALDLSLTGSGGCVGWSSRACFERVFAQAEGVASELVVAGDSALCAKALSADGVVLGGSGASAWQDTAFNDHLLDLIAICKMNEIPFLGICYGAQLLGRALGGHVARHSGGIELGAPAIRLTEEGRRHFLFEDVGGDCIWSVETHRDAVLTLPPGCALLASTLHTPVQAFSFGDRLLGVQFHPEMSGDDLRCLWQAFLREGTVDTLTEREAGILGGCQCEALPGVFRNFARRALELRRRRPARAPVR